MAAWTPRRIKGLRAKYGETQAVFAARVGVSVATLRKWEQDTEWQPKGPAANYLSCLEYFWSIGQVPEHPDRRHRKPNGPKPMPGADRDEGE